MSFRVGAQQLSAASGQVRCGRCQQVFNALQTLSDEAPPETPTPQLMDKDASDTHAVAESDIDPNFRIKGSSEDEPATITVAAAPTSRPESLNYPRPTDDTASGGNTFVWLIVNLLLVGVFSTQSAYAFRAELGQDLRLRPWLEQGCEMLNCELPAWTDPSQIEIIDREVRANTLPPGTLTIGITLVNTAPITQPLPTLQLTLARLDGNIIGLRRFTPAEISLTPNTRLPPDTPVRVSFDLLDPGEEAASFRFDLL
jgi:predicted Zn finger-like uncharacterized protein